MNIQLDAATHTYTVDNQRIPSFSEIAASYFPANEFWTERGRDEGTHIHSACALLLENDLDWASVEPSVIPRVRGFEKFLKESAFKPELALCEKPAYQPVLRFCCMPDFVGYLGNFSAIIEAKRGAKHPAHRLQTAAQLLALKAGGFKAQKRYALYLKDNDYRLEEHADPGDMPRWAAMVSGFHAARCYKES